MAMSRRSEAKEGLGRLPTPQQAAVLEFLADRDTNVVLCRWDTVFGWDQWRLWEPDRRDSHGMRAPASHYLHPTTGLAVVENGWVSLDHEYQCQEHYRVEDGERVLHGVGFSRTYAINARGHDALIELERA
jgi:hypothetical protein